MKLAPELLSLLKRYVPTGEIEGYRVMFRLAERVKMIAKPERTGSFDSMKDEAAHKTPRESQ